MPDYAKELRAICGQAEGCECTLHCAAALFEQLRIENELLDELTAAGRDVAVDGIRTHRKLNVLQAALRHYQECVLASHDAHIQEDYNEAYHQLYRAVEPTFTLQGDPFERLRVLLGGKDEST